MKTLRLFRASLFLGIPLAGLGGTAQAITDPEHITTWMWLFALPDKLLATVVIAVFIALAWLVLLYGRGNLRPVKDHPKAAIFATLGGALVGILLVLLAAGPWHAYLIDKITLMPPPAAVMPDEDRAIKLTNALTTLNRVSERASPAARDKALANLLTLAEERQALLAKLMATNPAAVLRVALPQAVMEGFPDPVQAFLEQHQVLDGTLGVISEDFPDRSLLRYYLNRDGDPISLHFVAAPALQLSGASVRASGVVLGGAMALEAKEAPGEKSNSYFSELAPGVALTTGDQKVLVIVADLADTPVACSLDEIDRLMFSDPDEQSVSDLYRESSFEQLMLDGQVVGPYRLDVTPGDSCDPVAWADLADQAAVANGVDITGYQRKLYVLPATPACSQVGLGQMGGIPSRAWTFRCDQASTYAHPLGHNLGLGHASSPTREYGDPTDVMGDFSGGLRQVNAVHKEQLGWLPPEQITAVTQGGEYRLAPIETDPAEATAPQALRIGKGAQEFYQLSYREPMGFDDKLDAAYLGRLTLHHYRGRGKGTTTYLLRSLANGETFTDPTQGISITQTTQNGNEMQARIDLTLDTCQAGVPHLAIAPPDVLGNPGETLQYDVMVTNMDRTSCPVRNFTLDTRLPLGWTGDISPRTIELSSGHSDTAILSATPATDSPTGTFGLAVTARDAGEPSLTGLTGSAYVLSLPCVRGTPALALSSSSQFGQAGAPLGYTLTLINTDRGDCPASSFQLSHALAADWSGKISPSTLNLAPGQQGSASFEITSATEAKPGVYEITASAIDPLVAAHGATGKGLYLLSGAEGKQALTLTAATTTTTLKRGTVKLAWNAPTDDPRVTGYYVWRNGTQIASVTPTSFTQTIKQVGTYNFYVLAHDTKGTISGPSNTLTIKIVR
jgi:hypothetical protein